MIFIDKSKGAVSGSEVAEGYVILSFSLSPASLVSFFLNLYYSLNNKLGILKSIIQCKSSYNNAAIPS